MYCFSLDIFYFSKKQHGKTNISVIEDKKLKEQGWKWLEVKMKLYFKSFVRSLKISFKFLGGLSQSQTYDDPTIKFKKFTVTKVPTEKYHEVSTKLQ